MSTSIVTGIHKKTSKRAAQHFEADIRIDLCLCWLLDVKQIALQTHTYQIAISAPHKLMYHRVSSWRQMATAQLTTIPYFPVRQTDNQWWNEETMHPMVIYLSVVN